MCTPNLQSMQLQLESQITAPAAHPGCSIQRTHRGTLAGPTTKMLITVTARARCTSSMRFHKLAAAYTAQARPNHPEI